MSQPYDTKTYDNSTQTGWLDRVDPTTEALESRVARYTRGKLRDEGFAQWLKENDEWKLGDAVGRCNSVLIFRELNGEGRAYLRHAECCRKFLLCQLCAILRGSRLLMMYSEAFVMRLLEKPSLRPYMVTFTVKGGENLAERFEHVRGSMQGLQANRRRCLSDRRKRAVLWTEMANADGGMWSAEVKRGRGSGLWHPHVHGIWLCEREPNVFALREEWKHLTGDSFIVDVRALHCCKELDKGLCGGALVDAVSLDLREVTKYNVKFASMEYSDCLHCFTQLRPGGRQKRLAGTFGSLRRLRGPDDVTDETDYLQRCLHDAEDVWKWIDYIYEWKQREGYELKSYGTDASVGPGSFGEPF